MFISRRKFALSAVFFLWLSVLPPYFPLNSASTIYTYTDDAGTLTFTTELDSIPQKYRSKVTTHVFDIPTTSPPAPPAVAEDVPPPSPPSENTRVVTAGGEYRMGDHDTRTDAVRLAVEAAKKDALEQVATYLENVTEVRNLDVTRDDIRTYTAGIVQVLDQTITTRLDENVVVIRADLTAQVDPDEVTRAIAALRENESAKSELLALRSETDQLQQQLDAANQALADASSPEQVQAVSQQRQDVLNELQANALVSQAWTSMAYATPGYYSYPWIGVVGVNGLLLQAQRLYPRHRHLPIAQQMVTALPGQVPTAMPSNSAPPRQSLLVPSAPHMMHRHQSPPLLTPSGVPAKVGDIVVMPSPRSVPPIAHQSSPQPQQQLHPSHFWRPSPPNVRTAPSVPSPGASLSPRYFGGSGKHSGRGGHSGGDRFGGGRGGRR